jgi:hypothetical protein
MEMLMEVIIFAAIGAALFRLRGSESFERVTGRGKTTADAVYAVGLALLFALTMPWWGVLALALALWLGGRPGWWKSLSLGRNPSDGSVSAQFARHTLRGVVWTAPAAVIAFALGASPIPLVLVGAACALVYEVGYRLSDRGGVFGRLGGTEWGELFFGAMIGVGLALTF